MGVVYAAVQEGLGRHVAVKLLDPRLAEDRVQLERFKREAEVVAALGHPNIVQVTDFHESDTQPFLVMELLHGESLAVCLAREQVLTAQRTAFIAAQLLSALGAAHRAGVVHRDIKPDNIFLLSDAAIPDTVKVLDFGIAKLAPTGNSAKLTTTGAMLGTPAFMAPEQARGAEDVDARADIYAVGATMYQALTGKMPHEASSIPALLFAIVEKIPVSLRELRPDLPADLVAVVERAMAKNRDGRFPDAASMRAALAPWSGLSASTPPPAVSATAATIASSHPGPIVARENATPIVVHRTPPPTPVVPYAPAPAPPPVRPKSRYAPLIVVLLLVWFIGNSFLKRIFPTARETSTARPDDSADIEYGRSIARQSLGIAASALGVAPPAPPAPPLVVEVQSASVAASTSAPAAVRHRYSGTHAYASSRDFEGCMQCDFETYNAAIGAKDPEVSACFKSAVNDPPIHQLVYYTVSVDGSGALVGFDSSTTPMPTSLDTCLRRVMRSIPLDNKTGKPGSFKIGFSGECPKWARPDGLKWCPE